MLVIHIQNVRMGSEEKATQFLQYICENAQIITKLCVNMQVFNAKVLESLLQLVVAAKNIRLEEIHFRRRYVGQQFDALIELVIAHARTLRVVGKLGLGEAVRCFGEKMKLKRCSLMNFDLVERGELESADLRDATHACIRRLSGLGTTFTHLSLTAYSNIQLSRQPMLFFLRACGVESVRLTMQKGCALPASAYPRPLLRGLRSIELVGQLDVDTAFKPSVVFPNLEHYDLQYVDLATNPADTDDVRPSALGVQLRDRTVSEAVSEADRVSPTEFDCDNDRQVTVGDAVAACCATMAAVC